MGIVKQNGVQFMTFLLEKYANQWWRAFIEYGSLVLTLLTWEKFHALFLEKYKPHSL